MRAFIKNAGKGTRRVDVLGRELLRSEIAVVAKVVKEPAIAEKGLKKPARA